MKRAATLSILSLLVFVSASAQLKTDRTVMGLIGPVKSIETGSIEYKLKDNKSVEGVPIPHHRITFNIEGNKTEESSYQDGVFLARNVYTYDSSGTSTGYEETYMTPAKTVSKPRKHESLTDGRGNITQSTVYESDGSMAIKFTYRYDQSGNKTEEQVYYHTGASGGRTVHKYDDAGRETETIAYNGDGAVTWKQNIKYDNEGRRTEWIQYRGEILKYRTLTKYDDQGRTRKQETLEFNATPGYIVSHDPTPGKITYSYDDERRTKEVITYDADGVLKGKVIYFYDERRNEIKRLEFDADGSPKDEEIRWYDNQKLLRSFRGKNSARFEYDSHGNWTKKTYFLAADSKEAEAYSAEYRTITYY